MSIFLLTIVAIALIMAGMAVGVVFANRSLRGSCGGAPVLGPDGDPLGCPDCNCKTPEIEIGDPASTGGGA